MAKQPNFILFMTDQQRWDHLGCNGNKVLKTPNIDAIAARGVRFDKFSVASAVCMPNRATLATGRMPSLHGVRYNGVPLTKDSVTFVDLLRAAGYNTGLCGKSHLQNFSDMEVTLPPYTETGAPPPSDLQEARRGTIRGSEYEEEKPPKEERQGYLNLQTPFYGFDHVDLVTRHGDRARGHYDEWLKEQHADADSLRGADNAIPEPNYCAPQAWHTSIPEEHYTSTYVADKSAEFLEANAVGKNDAPFFLQCSFPDPHHPYTPPGKYFTMYDPDDIELPGSYNNSSPQPTTAFIQQQTLANAMPRTGNLPFATTERETREIIAVTYGMISMVDDCIGRVVQKLEDLGLAEDTVLLFTSDHGDFMGDHGIMLKGPLHYQSLINVPFIWADPRDGLSDVRNQELGGTIDIARTVLARADLAPYNGMQGHDLGPLMRGEVDKVRDGLILEQDSQKPNFHFDTPIKARTYLTTRWRLSRYMGSKFGELYDLVKDPLEMDNLWNDPDHASVKGELLGEMVMAMIEHQETSPHPTDFA